jgi:hypothetical protein
MLSPFGKLKVPTESLVMFGENMKIGGSSARLSSIKRTATSTAFIPFYSSSDLWITIMAVFSFFFGTLLPILFPTKNTCQGVYVEPQFTSSIPCFARKVESGPSRFKRAAGKLWFKRVTRTSVTRGTPLPDAC